MPVNTTGDPIGRIPGAADQDPSSVWLRALFGRQQQPQMTGQPQEQTREEQYTPVALPGVVGRIGTGSRLMGMGQQNPLIARLQGY